MLVMFIGSLKLIFLIAMTLYRTNISAFDTNFSVDIFNKGSNISTYPGPRGRQRYVTEKGTILLTKNSIMELQTVPMIFALS